MSENYYLILRHIYFENNECFVNQHISWPHHGLEINMLVLKKSRSWSSILVP